MYVTVNMAITLDGRISTKNRTPATFSSSRDFQRLLELRAEADALLVGKGTLVADTMRMTVPSEVLGNRTAPLRCVLSKSGILASDHPVFSVQTPPLHFFIVGEQREIDVPFGSVHFIQVIPDMLEKLAALGVSHVHCEGGGEVVRSLIDLDLVDKLYLTWNGGHLFGGYEAPFLTGSALAYLAQTKHFCLKSMEVGSEGECYLLYERGVGRA